MRFWRCAALVVHLNFDWLTCINLKILFFFIHSHCNYTYFILSLKSPGESFTAPNPMQYQSGYHSILQGSGYCRGALCAVRVGLHGRLEPAPAISLVQVPLDPGYGMRCREGVRVSWPSLSPNPILPGADLPYSVASLFTLPTSLPCYVLLHPISSSLPSYLPQWVWEDPSTSIGRLQSSCQHSSSKELCMLTERFSRLP